MVLCYDRNLKITKYERKSIMNHLKYAPTADEIAEIYQQQLRNYELLQEINRRLIDIDERQTKRFNLKSARDFMVEDWKNRALTWLHQAKRPKFFSTTEFIEGAALVADGVKIDMAVKRVVTKLLRAEGFETSLATYKGSRFLVWTLPTKNQKPQNTELDDLI